MTMINSKKTQEQEQEQEQEEEITSLKDLADNGWYDAKPPALNDDIKVIGIIRGFRVRVPQQFELSESPITMNDELIHRRFRTGKYDVDLRLHIAGDMVTNGEIKVETAEGYDENK
jgi:hypothetical protein